MLTHEPMDEVIQREPRWLAVVAMLAVGLLFMALPGYLSVGPRWLLLAVVALMLAATVISHRAGHHEADRLMGYLASGILTVAMVWSLVLLIGAIPKHEIEARVLLRSASALWVTNILVFALWYWRLDAGGPHARERRQGHEEGAFLFPQMNMAEGAEPGWSPTFI